MDQKSYINDNMFCIFPIKCEKHFTMQFIKMWYMIAIKITPQIYKDVVYDCH